MSGKVFRWRKKPGTGSHTFKYKGESFFILPGESVIAPVESMGSASLQYEPIAEIVDGKSRNFQGRHPYEALQDIFFEEEEEIAIHGGPEIIAVGGGWYNVINPDNPDKPLSDKNLRREDAENMVIELGGELPEDED